MVNTPYDLKRPKELEEYILRDAADKAYLIFDKTAGTKVCTRCGTEREWNPAYDVHLKHNTEHYCVDCGETVICKEKRYGRKNITEYGRVIWLTADEEKTYAQLDLYQIDYTGDYPKVWFLPEAQYLFTKEEQKYYKLHCGCFDEEWEQKKDIKLPSAYSYMGCSRFHKTIAYIPAAQNLGTDLRYAKLEDKEDPYMIIGYFANFLKYQSIELLEKAGFENLVKERAKGYGCRGINWRGKTLEKILKMSKYEIKEFRPYATLYNLERYNQAKKAGIKLKFSQVHYITYGWEEDIKIIRRYTTAEKAMEYLDKQAHASLRIYADYLKECRKLGFDMKNRKVLRPKNLAEAHAVTSQMIRDNADEVIRKTFASGLATVYDKGEFHCGDLLIRPAADVKELDAESTKLRHCVRTYKEKVAKGKCAILFVRMEADPDTPYYTLELSPEGKIVQCRGLLNCAMTDEVKEFVDTWLKKIVQQKQKGAA